MTTTIRAISTPAPPRFSPGRVVATCTLLAALGYEHTHASEHRHGQAMLNDKDILACLGRHLAGDWGELDAHDRATNEAALREGGRLLSAYTVRSVKLWIITEANRSSTTLLLPEDY